jgi:alpha-mannosidase
MVQMKPNPYVDDLDLVSIQHTMDDVIRPQIYPEIKALDATFSATPEPVPFQEKDTLAYHKIKEGQKWAHSYFECAWFHLQGEVPEGENLKDLYLAFDCSGEAELYDEEGNALKGFTNGTTVYEDNLIQSKRYYPLANVAKNGKINVYFDCGANDIFGRYIYKGKYLLGGIAKRNDEIFDIFYDIQILYDYLKTSGKTSPYYQPVFAGLKKVRSLYLYQDPEAYPKAKAITKPLLAIPSANSFRAVSVGHAHLDLIWLWPLRESYRKEIRTISNAVYLLDTYPAFTYVCSQPQQVEWLKEKAPSLFEKFKHYVALGRIELVGGSWVESDTNLIGEEAFMRQMLYGQKFWKENFGHYTEVMWLPDTFGYNGNIPQILRESGQKYFVTIKISWNQYNLFPYHSFVWEGIDGSKVLSPYATG